MPEPRSPPNSWSTLLDVPNNAPGDGGLLHGDVFDGVGLYAGGVVGKDDEIGKLADSDRAKTMFVKRRKCSTECPRAQCFLGVDALFGAIDFAFGAGARDQILNAQER